MLNLVALLLAAIVPHTSAIDCKMPPFIDGAYTDGEWTGSAQSEFNAAYARGAKLPIKVNVANDGHNLFVAIRCECYGVSASEFTVTLRDAGGARDQIALSRDRSSKLQFKDSYEAGKSFQPDDPNGTYAAQTDEGGLLTIEMTHPLSGDDAHDINVKPPQPLDYWLAITLYDRNGARYNTVWPGTLSVKGQSFVTQVCE